MSSQGLLLVKKPGTFLCFTVSSCLPGFTSIQLRQRSLQKELFGDDATDRFLKQFWTTAHAETWRLSDERSDQNETSIREECRPYIPNQRSHFFNESLAVNLSDEVYGKALAYDSLAYSARSA